MNTSSWIPFNTSRSLNIVFFWKILKLSGLLPFSAFPRGQCVYTHQAGRTPALQPELAEFRKMSFEGKTQYLMNTL